MPIRYYSSKLANLMARVRQRRRERGWGAAVRHLTRWILVSIGYYLHRTFRSRRRFLRGSRRFDFQGREYEYFLHRHNTTWVNERAVEVPIIWEHVQQHEGGAVLEVGNVLSRYFNVTHDVLDKYDTAQRVIRADAADFRPARAYDLIVSISTLEHIGWDDQPREPGKTKRTVENLIGCLAPGGQLVLTFPLGYNADLDRLIERDEIAFASRFYLRRVSRENQWVEAAWDEVRGAKFNEPFYSANAVVIAKARARP